MPSGAGIDSEIVTYTQLRPRLPSMIETSPTLRLGRVLSLSVIVAVADVGEVVRYPTPGSTETTTVSVTSGAVSSTGVMVTVADATPLARVIVRLVAFHDPPLTLLTT